MKNEKINLMLKIVMRRSPKIKIIILVKIFKKIIIKKNLEFNQEDLITEKNNKNNNWYKKLTFLGKGYN